MNPCNLTDEQYALFLNDKNLQNCFPNLERGDPTHISLQFNYAQWWEKMQVEHPEVIERAKAALKEHPLSPGASIGGPGSDKILEVLVRVESKLDAMLKLLSEGGDE